MITVMNYKTARMVELDEKDIVKVTEGSELIANHYSPFSDITYIDKHGKEAVLRVVESASYIGKLMAEAIRNRVAAKNKEEAKA